MADTLAADSTAPGWHHSRPSTGALGLATVRWLAELPEEIRPKLTATRFPHIVDTLCMRWLKPASCRAYFDEVLFDVRGDRQGFPPPVALELAALKDYYEAGLSSTLQGAWGEAAGRSRA